MDMDAIKRLTVPQRVRLAQDIWETLQPTARDLPLGITHLLSGCLRRQSKKIRRSGI